jgi:hypothetical protein
MVEIYVAVKNLNKWFSCGDVECIVLVVLLHFPPPKSFMRKFAFPIERDINIHNVKRREEKE